VVATGRPDDVDFDPGQLAALAEHLPDERIREFAELFLKLVGEEIARIRNALDHDFAAVGHHAHALVGGAGNVGAARLSRLAHDLEAACKAGTLDEATRLVTEVDQAAAAATGELQVWLDERKTVPGEAPGAAEPTRSVRTKRAGSRQRREHPPATDRGLQDRGGLAAVGTSGLGKLS
jgi:HPt (histidine-containing phosphotransfer) domain-containing protein